LQRSLNLFGSDRKVQTETSLQGLFSKIVLRESEKKEQLEALQF